jgi:hypothetical protein
LEFEPQPTECELAFVDAAKKFDAGDTLTADEKS